MVDVVVWKNLQMKYIKKLFIILKDKANEEFSHSFISNYGTMKSSHTTQVTNILSDMLQFFMWYSLLMISGGMEVYVQSYFNISVIVFSLSLQERFNPKTKNLTS